MLNFLYPVVGLFLVVKATKWALNRKWFAVDGAEDIDNLAARLIVKKRLAAAGDPVAQRDLNGMRMTLRRLERLSLQGDPRAQEILDKLKSLNAISPDDYQTREG
jgi:hypothetical protein